MTIRHSPYLCRFEEYLGQSAWAAELVAKGTSFKKKDDKVKQMAKKAPEAIQEASRSTWSLDETLKWGAKIGARVFKHACMGRRAWSPAARQAHCQTAGQSVFGKPARSHSECHAVQGLQNRSSPLSPQTQEREALLAKLLKQRLLKYTEGDEAGFRSHVQREVRELAKLPFGIAMLHCIGWAPAAPPPAVFVERRGVRGGRRVIAKGGQTLQGFSSVVHTATRVASVMYEVFSVLWQCLPMLCQSRVCSKACATEPPDTPQLLTTAHLADQCCLECKWL